MPLTGNIFIADADIEKNITRSQAPNYNTRTFSGVLAHEITHGLIRRRVGWIRALFLPGWLAEGYCDYVAQESSFPTAEGLRLLASGAEDPSPSFRYFVGRQAVAHLIVHDHLSFDALVARAHDFEAVKRETCAALRSN